MPTRAPPPRPPPLAKVGQIAAAFTVFFCGYLAFRSSDWRLTVLFSLLSVVAAILASRFSAAGR